MSDPEYGINATWPETYDLIGEDGDPITYYCIDDNILAKAFDGWSQTKYDDWTAFKAKTVSYMSIISRLATACKAFRCLRLLKLARQYEDSIVLVKAFDKSAKAMRPPFFFLTVIVTLMASVCYYGELIAMGSEEHMAFSHIPHAMWFMLVTMTTVRQQSGRESAANPTENPTHRSLHSRFCNPTLHLPL